MSILSEDQLDNMRKAGSIVRECLDCISREVKTGIDTKSLEEKAEEFVAASGGLLAFRGYKGFPAGICTSRNSVVVHGIPSDEEILEEGDIISVDIGVDYKGYFADAARTFAVGKISPEAKRLIAVSRDSLHRGIKMARGGNTVQDISWAIQSYVESEGFSVVRAFVGHGIGKRIHEEPEIPNFGTPHKGRILEEKMALAIEPMVNAGTSEVKILDDGWTAVTKDGRLSAHFEHTVIVGRREAEVLT